MICPSCKHDNIDGVDTCDACGLPMWEFDPAGDELEQAISRHTIEVLVPKEVVSVQTTTLVRDAIQEMVDRNIGCLIVEEDGKLSGVFTERDVLNKISEDLSTLDHPVSEFMTSSPDTVTNQDFIAHALQEMDLGGYRHLPIVNEHGTATGILSVRDILRYLCVRFAELRSQAS